MSARRLFEIARQDLLHNLRRPLFWVMIALLAFLTWSLSMGHAQMSSGDARVGGQKAWITSEFAVAQLIIMLTCILYVFFIAVAAGMSLIRDDEHKVGELLHSTPLTPGEYVWGKYLAVLASFVGVLGIHLGLSIVFNHFVPHAENAEFIGPLRLANYLRPALVFGLPTLVLFSGTCFAIGGGTRKPVLVFAAPIAVLIGGAFFLWDWSPVWLPLAANRVLQFVDLTGLRWMKETWLLVDKGVDYYNVSRVGLDALIVSQRLLCVAIGLGSVAWLHGRFAASLRGTRVSAREAEAARAAAAPPAASSLEALPALASLGMRSGAPGFAATALEVARAELHGILRHPGLYLFVPLILLQTLANEYNVGAFDTRLLNTSGLLAVGMMNTLTLLVCMMILFYTTESLQRERTTGLGAIYYATPLDTGAMLAGKALANSVLGVAIVVACLIGCLVIIAVQGKVPLSLGPFALVWGLLMLPTFLLWTSYVGFVQSLTSNRYGTYTIALATMTLTAWFQMRGKMNWVFNWDLWSATRWSDIATLEYDRVPLLLNRILWLGAAALFTVLAVRLFERRERDATRIVHALRPGALARAALVVTPLLLVPVTAGTLLGLRVHDGYGGGVLIKKGRDYWKKNIQTWKDAPGPSLAGVDFALDLDPAKRALAVRGWYDLVNDTDAPLDSFPVTVNPAWSGLRWTLNGDSLRTENRASLHIVTLPRPLVPGATTRLGFAYEGRQPYGISKNGAAEMEFVMPSSIVLTALGSPTMAPQLGYNPDVGVEEDKNQSDPREWPARWYEGVTPAGLLMAGHWFDSHITVTVPADLMVNATGELVREEVKNGRRTTEWRTDHPVRIFNVVAGHWKVKTREGVAVYYDPRHPYNVDEMLDGLEGARKWYGQWFAPLPWKTLRLSEFAGLPTYAQAPPGNITFSENIGFLTLSKPDANAAFWITAHEAAHQWWPNLAMVGDGPGSEVLSEGMAHFSTMLLTEQVRGLEQRMAFCRQVEDRYGYSRQKDSERPLVRIDGHMPGDRRVIYDKGGWAFYMLHRWLGPDASFAALREYLETFRNSRDHAALEDYLAIMRRHAADTTAFDAFAKQWFLEVSVPEYKIEDATAEKSGGGWIVRATVRNAGTGLMPVEVAAARGERFPHGKKDAERYADARTTITLGAGEKRSVAIACRFQPQRLVVDPDVTVLMLERQKAEVKLRVTSGPLASAAR
jgi:ABC-2 type transport system permease protein